MINTIDVSGRIRRAIHLNDLGLLRRIVERSRIDLRSIGVHDDVTGHEPVGVNVNESDHINENGNGTAKNDGDTCRSQQGDTFLHFAIRLGRLEVVKYLVDSGHEDQSISRNANLDTPLHVAVSVMTIPKTSPPPPPPPLQPPKTTTRTVADQITVFLAQRFPASIALRNKDGANVIMLCAKAPESQALPQSPPPQSSVNVSSNGLLAELLSLNPSGVVTAVQSVDLKGNTPLHYAAAYGRLHNIKILLDADSDPTASNAWSWTALDYSATVSVEVHFRGLIAARNAENLDNSARPGTSSSMNSGYSRSRSGSTTAKSGSGSGLGGGTVRLVGREDQSKTAMPQYPPQRQRGFSDLSR